MSITLYRKYRPQVWADIAGQNHVKVTLSFEVASGNIAHAYLFSGPRGVGKTTAARILSRAINCERRSGKASDGGEPCGECGHCAMIAENRCLDVIEIDAASHRGIDAVRDNIIENARFSPSTLRYKVFIIDEVHMLTTEAFNALLKTLEEPPAHAVFVLATTELHKVPPTIVSRCQRFDFKKIPFSDLVDRLHGVAEKEGFKVDRRTLEEIARNADGSLRDAEGLLGKVLAVADGKRVTYDEALVVLPRSDFALVASFVDALVHADGRSALLTIADGIDAGVDIDQFAGDVIETLRKTLLMKMSGDAQALAFDLDEEQKKRLEEWAKIGDVARLARMLELLLEKRRDIRLSSPPQLPIEIAAVLITTPESAAPQHGGDLWHRKEDRVEKKAPAPPVRASAPQPSKAVVAEEPPVIVLGKEATDAPAEASTPAAISIETIRNGWPDFMRRAGEENHGLPYLLVKAEPIAVLGNLVRLGFEFAFHRDKLNQHKSQLAIERAFEAAYGIKLHVEGILLERKGEIGDAAPVRQEVEAVAPSVAQNILSAFGGRVLE